MHRSMFISCKIRRCLTLQRKLTVAESCYFLVVVNTGKYFFRVCQIPNHIISYSQGTAPCGDVKYLAKWSITCFRLVFPLVPVARMLSKLLSHKVLQLKPIVQVNEIMQYAASLYYAIAKLRSCIQWSVKNPPLICQHTECTL